MVIICKTFVRNMSVGVSALLSTHIMEDQEPYPFPRRALEELKTIQETSDSPQRISEYEHVCVCVRVSGCLYYVLLSVGHILKISNNFKIVFLIEWKCRPFSNSQNSPKTANFLSISVYTVGFGKISRGNKFAPVFLNIQNCVFEGACFANSNREGVTNRSSPPESHQPYRTKSKKIRAILVLRVLKNNLIETANS